MRLSVVCVLTYSVSGSRKVEGDWGRAQSGEALTLPGHALRVSLLMLTPKTLKRRELINDSSVRARNNALLSPGHNYNNQS